MEILLIALVVSLWFHYKQSFKRVKFLKGFQGDALTFGIAFALLVHFLDILSTMVGMRVGLIESNPLMRDPMTFQFLLLPGIGFKALAVLVFDALPGWFILRATKNPLLAAIPFFWDGYGTLEAVFNNIALLLMKLHGN